MNTKEQIKNIYIEAKVDKNYSLEECQHDIQSLIDQAVKDDRERIKEGFYKGLTGHCYGKEICEHITSKHWDGYVRLLDDILNPQEE